jgi:hypothetical protein
MALRVEVKTAPIVVNTKSFSDILDKGDLDIALKKMASPKLGERTLKPREKQLYLAYLQLQADKNKPGI